MFKKLSNILESDGFEKKKKSSFTPKYSGDDFFDFIELINSWEEIVGKNLSAHTIPLKNVRNELTLLTDHPVYAQQLSMMDQVIISSIVKKFPQLKNKIKAIKFYTNTKFFQEVKSKSTVEKKKKIEKDSKQKFHKYSPTFNKLKNEAEKFFDDVDDDESKKLLKSIYIQSRYEEH